MENVSKEEFERLQKRFEPLEQRVHVLWAADKELRQSFKEIAAADTICYAFCLGLVGFLLSFALVLFFW